MSSAFARDTAGIPYVELLSSAEHALRAGDTARASDLFERAAGLRHETSPELGIARTHMQAGRYRQALAFAAHVAGAHADESGGSALYTWLLHIGGQAQAAARVLESARERLVDDRDLAAVAALLATPAPAPAGHLLEAPLRLAPFSAQSDAIGAGARVLASGVVAQGGRAVLTSARALGSASRGWVRDGLGRLSAVTVDRSFADVDLAVLHLEHPLPAPDHERRAQARDPFPGSPAFAVEFSTAVTTPAWPLLRIGFLGTPSGPGRVYRLGVGMPAGPRGGPVFDAAGRLVGVATTDEKGGNRIVMMSEIRARAGLSVPASASFGGSAMPVDEIYEHALAATVQVIVDDPR